MASIEVSGPPVDRSAEVLTAEALEFLADLQRQFGARRDELLAARRTRRERIAAGERPAFLDSTAEIRGADWQVAPAPRDLRDRRVEITGPTSRKMAINALNSGARVWLADLEDANTPHWRNVVEGQVNLADAVRRTIAFTSPEGKGYQLKDPDHLPVILPRPRGWHLDEAHLTLDGRPLVGGLVDFGLYFFHNAAEQLSRGSGPYFYLPKMESHLEARLWNDVFCHAQHELGDPAGLGPRDRADRDDHRGVRDGGDPLGAPRPRQRAERRPLGLPVQHHQELPRGRRRSPSPTAARSP